MMAAENLKVGARGWRHQQWLSSYYPDDLPEDWQLGFYANNFSVVMVPAEYWSPSRGYDLEEWIDGVNEDFRFYLEYPLLDTDEAQHFQSQCVDMGDLLGGVIVTDNNSLDELNLPCPVLQAPSFDDGGVGIGFLDKDFDNLRKVRVWFEAFDKSRKTEQTVVFVGNGSENDISMETLSNIKTLSEMMGL